MKIAQIAPLAESCPPGLNGGRSFALSLDRRYADRIATTLFGRLDLPDLKAFYSAFPEPSPVSISDAQRHPMPRSTGSPPCWSEPFGLVMIEAIGRACDCPFARFGAGNHRPWPKRVLSCDRRGGGRGGERSRYIGSSRDPQAVRTTLHGGANGERLSDRLSLVTGPSAKTASGRARQS